MITFLIIITTIAVTTMMIVLKKEKKEENDDSKLTRIELVVAVLKRIGCQPEFEDDQITFTYKEQVFTIDAGNEYLFIKIWRIWGSRAHLDSNITLLKEAINITNRVTLTTIVYTTDEEENLLGIHFGISIPFTHQIPDIDNCLRAILDNSFETEEKLREEFASLIAAPSTKSENSKRVRIKGFSK